MSNSRLHNSGKSGDISCSTIGFRFHANDEELEELQLEQNHDVDKKNGTNLELKIDSTLLSSETLDSAKSDRFRSDSIGDPVKDPWSRLGKRSISVDSNYESPFSNPIETWRKLNELKEKITKTVEEKISEMKTDRNAVNKSGRSKLLHSKENSSVSDSEDTSESSKLSENWKDAEDLSTSSTKVSIDTPESISSCLETAVENVKMELEKRTEAEAELRNRKASTKISDVIKLPDIKIVTAKSEIEGNLVDDNLTEEVESGVEADENLIPMESESVGIFDSTTNLTSGGGSQQPGRPDSFSKALDFLTSEPLTQTYTVILILGFGLYIFSPMSEFMKGFLLCFVLMVSWKIMKGFVQLDESSFIHQGPLVIPNYKSMPPLKVPHFKTVNGVWVNEYERDMYDPDYYSVTQTVPAYIELNDSILKISRPKGKIHKRATYDEPEYKLQFISERVYNISGCNVYLMPEGLTRKRLFSKKYPIVIFLKPDSLISEKVKGKEVDEKESNENVEVDEAALSSPESPRMKSSLYLFARCDRQKEEWYRKLLAAARLPSTPVHHEKPFEHNGEKESCEDSPTKEPSTPFETLFFDDEVALVEEYLRYMAKFVDMEMTAPEKFEKRRNSFHKKKKKRKDMYEDSTEHHETVAVNNVYQKDESSRTSVNAEGSEEIEQDEIIYPSLQVHWFNAFINRILFDVFRSPYWLSKIHEKVERKLNSIRLPFYIEDIEVVELDLGKTGPTFHRVSPPYLDERGLWFDMDTTFDGLIKLTIQTHLNLIKLQKGFRQETETTHTHEKPEKGKKKHKEIKEALLIKESKTERASASTYPLDEKHEGQSSTKNSELCPSLDYSCSEESKLLDEVAKFAEIAVEETLIGNVPDEPKRKFEGSSPGNKHRKKRSPIYDSELEDSAESSDEDEIEEDTPPPIYPLPEAEEETPVSKARRYPKNRRSSKRIFRVFENVAQSKYFKSVAQSKYVQKAIAGVSATKLRLTLEIKSCTGILVVNIPPPPSDRFWYGFREMPKLVFSANPKIGDKALRFVHIKNYLQKKILYELKKVMVWPNMIDFVLPTSAPVRSSSSLQIELPDLDEQESTPTE